MKRFKKIFINLLAVLMIGVACFGLMACEDIRTIEVTVSVYNADDSTMVEKVIKVDMYRHLAPNTVDKITEYVNEGYYNDAMFHCEKFDCYVGENEYCNEFEPEKKQIITIGDIIRKMDNTDLAEMLVYPVKPMNVNGNIYYEFTSCLLLGKSYPMHEQAVFLTERRLNAPAGKHQEVE